MDNDYRTVTTVAPSSAHAKMPARPAPNIYYLSPLLAGPLGHWAEILERIARLGFDHVLISPPFATGASLDLFLPADYARLDPRLGWSGSAEAGLARIVEHARGYGLAVLLDVVVDQAASGSPLARANPTIFADFDPERALDPRGASGNFEAARIRPEAPELALWWAGQIRAWDRIGIAGFRIVAPGSVGIDVLRAIRGAAPASLLLGWTEGTSPAHLGGAGFDFLFCSLPWWDFRSDWFWTELDALGRIAPLIAAPEAPFGSRLATRCHDPALLRPAYCRNLRLAAAIAPAWMMPMGFEFAAWRQMHPACDAPEDFAAIAHAAPFDLSAEIASVNEARRVEPALAAIAPPTVLAGEGAASVALLRGRVRSWESVERPVAILANLDPARRHTLDTASLSAASTGAFERFDPVLPTRATWLAAGDSLTLEPGEVMVYRAQPATPQRIERPPIAITAEGAARKPRIAIEAISPAVEHGTHPAKRIAGESVTVEADIIADGHDVLGAVLLWRAAEDSEWQEAPMHPLGNDRWQGRFPVARVGPYFYTVEAWRDAFGTFRDELGKKHTAGVDTALEVTEGSLLVAETAKRSEDEALRAMAARLLDEAFEEQRTLLLCEDLARLMAAADPRAFATRIEPALQILAERSAARFASWYEIFPRSMSDDPDRHGTFDDVIRHLPRIRDMGFDVLYLPPVHPIGRVNRKGRNNSLLASPDDPGSPYAIGSQEGGHDEIHPALGKLEDFRRLREAAERQGIELALDFAIQCAPDHPWLADYKEWFNWRPDGSLRYAENPPKKYEDIVNVDFYAPGSIPSLWIALCETVLYWADEGVRLFRVDNPHTKPLPFWEWMIGEVRARHPDAIFLSEAFTRPKMMYRLAKVGFSQSYTYFIWRNTKRELTEYMQELTTTGPREFFRPHFFVNTPDINPLFLQAAGRPGFLIRAALAATLSGLWGVYCGFELCEAHALPGREEYADSEKYQIRAWDWDRPGNIVAEIAQLNQIRKANPALQTHLNVQFHNAWNDAVLYYEKATPDRSNVLLIAVSLDPNNAQEADFEAPLWNWGLPDSASLHVEDLLSGGQAIWTGKRQHMRLEPAMPYAIWRVRPAG